MARVHSNVRRFRHESFVVWRCAVCGSIHSRDPVDLDYYYRDYPFNAGRLNLRRLLSRLLLRRLRRAGLAPGASVLDYGCGTGSFVRYLRECGHAAYGYDPYCQAFADPGVLLRQYDCVFAQDVLEHVANPPHTLDVFGKLAAPHGLIAIGTPDADAIDLGEVERHIHLLHQPYHRHIVSRRQMLAESSRRDWALVQFDPVAYYNTLLPGINMRMWLRYARTFDNTLDLAFEPPRFHPRLLSPAAVSDALFGGWRCPPWDVFYVFSCASERAPVAH